MDSVLLTDEGVGESGKISSSVSSLWFDGPFCIVVSHKLMKDNFPLAAIDL